MEWPHQVGFIERFSSVELHISIHSVAESENGIREKRAWMTTIQYFMSQDRRSEKRDCIDTERYSRQIRLDGIGTEGQVRHCGDL